MRMNTRRYTRLTRAFSRRIENHGATVALHVQSYDFAQSEKSPPGPYPRTPAMAAGVADHIWSLREIGHALAWPADSHDVLDDCDGPPVRNERGRPFVLREGVGLNDSRPSVSALQCDAFRGHVVLRHDRINTSRNQTETLPTDTCVPLSCELSHHPGALHLPALAMSDDETRMLGAKCDLLRSLHVPGKPLVLPNAWDVASARAVVAAGFPVVATSSGAVVATLGHEDHQGAPAEEMLAVAARIARSVGVPVTIDAEGGYGMAAANLVQALFETGVAGCNLEDTDHAGNRVSELDVQTERLGAVREAATGRGYGLVINARIDVFLANRDRPQGELLDEAVARGRAYWAKGADCVFPIFLTEPEVISSFVHEVAAPVNVLAVPQAPPPAQLREFGVARISYGSGLHLRSMEELDRLLEDIHP
jgi:2-methylisocitrate lyase-like PEP mutase family enzyme